MIIRKRFAAFAVLLILLVLLCGCSAPKETEPTTINSLDDLEGKKIATLTGAVQDSIASQYIKNPRFEYYNTNSDTGLALETGKADAYVSDEPIARMMLQEYPSHRILQQLTEDDYAFIFGESEKGEEIHDKLNEFLAEIRVNGTMEEMKEIWFGTDTEKQVIDFSGLTAENGTLKFITTTSVGVPFAYIKDGEYCGYDIDTAVRFCREYGYGIEIQDMAFTGMLAALTSGKVDFGAACVTVTEERKQSGLKFSEPNYTGGIVLVVKDSAAKETKPEGINSLADLEGKKVGVLTGSVFDKIAEKYIKDIQIEYFNDTSDISLALNFGKIDGYITNSLSSRMLLEENPTQHCLTTLEDDLFGFIFPKTEKGAVLRDQFNEFLAEIKADGTLEEIDSVWFGSDESRKVVDTDSLTGENGVLHYATCSGQMPFSYIKDGKMAGYEIDIAARFCKEYGYSLDISDGSFTSVIASVSSEKSEFGSAGISITEERKESMHFSEPDYSGGIVVVVKDSAAKETKPEGINSLADLEGKRIGIQTGTIHDTAAEKYIKNPQFVYTNSPVDNALALDAGKIDAYLVDEPFARVLFSEYPKQQVLATLEDDEYGFVFPKTERGAALRDQFNEFLAEIKTDGTTEVIDSVWFGTDESLKVVDTESLTGENGTLQYVVESGPPPFVYIQDGKFCGYEIDLAVRFCKKYGYGLEISDTNFSGVLASISSGKSDFGSAGISITEERKESMYFSEPDYSGGIVVVVKDSAEKGTGADEIRTVADMEGKKIGVVTGTVFGQSAEKHIPKAAVEYFNATPDLSTALEAGKIDGYIVDEPIMRVLTTEKQDQKCLTILEDDNYGFIFPKTEEGAALRDQFNEYLAKIKEDGTLEEIDSNWFGTNEALKDVDFASLTGENGTLIFSTCATTQPFAYIKNGKLVGYEVDLAARFCKEYGYGLEISDSTFSGAMAAVSGGKSNFGAAGFSITEERKETMYFSEPDYIGGIALVVKGSKPKVEEKDSFLDGILESFEKTFIREGRWKLFVSGIGITLLITVLSALFGTAIGFLLYLVYRKKLRIFNGFMNVLMDILEKTPVVVILMILYYIIFGKSNLDGVWVSIIGFSVMFACTFVGTVNIGVQAVDKGQTEASLALGFTDTKGFLDIILPQAAKHFMPNYRSNIVALLKDTAIVGYIAVQDLTKVGDIVRSRTYEAFFPLIATAVIYFLLAWLLTILVRQIEFGTDPTHRSKEKILKGVKTK